MADKPTLAYWNFRGVGNPVRILLAHLEVDFEDKRYDIANRESWDGEKETLSLRFPNIPYFIDGDFRISECQAVMQYICAKHRREYLGRTLEEQARAWEVSSFFDDNLWKTLAKLFGGD
mmetsp:Transcript_26563/g.4674  ORF Transcript_26563/g.4674 Transcript_26563/m.4674 type:complete len:119 (+) Transcript_26563:27-383(+)